MFEPAGGRIQIVEGLQLDNECYALSTKSPLLGCLERGGSMKRLVLILFTALFLLTAVVVNKPVLGADIGVVVLGDQKKDDKKKDPPGPPPVKDKGQPKGEPKPRDKKPGN
jgi:hypothetical protein